MFNLSSIGQYAPAVQAPPSPQVYHCPLQLSQAPSPRETDAIENKLGEKINPDYTSGRKMTPTQMKRLIAISVTAVCAILAVGAVIAACTVAWPIGLAAVVLAGVAIGCGIYAATRTDLDSPEVRDNVMEKIARRMSFVQIVRAYKSEDLTGYRLLDRAITRADDTSHVRAVAYAKFQTLANELGNADNWKNGSLGHVRSIHDSATRTFHNWYHDQKARIADARRMLDQEHEIARLRHENRHLHGERPTTGERVVGVIHAGIDAFTEAHLRQVEMDLERQYGAAMTPWQTWLNGEESRVRNGYSQAASALEDRYALMKV